MAGIDSKRAYDIVLQSWILHCLKTCKIPDQIVQFIEKTMPTWRVELTAGGQRLAEIKIQRGIFQEDAVSPLLFVIAMMPLNHIVRKGTAGYKLSKLQEKVNRLMYMDDIKPFYKKRKIIGNPNANSENIQSRYRNGMWHRKMRRASNEKWQTTHNRRYRTTKSSSHQNARGKGNLQIPVDIGS